MEIPWSETAVWRGSGRWPTYWTTILSVPVRRQSRELRSWPTTFPCVRPTQLKQVFHNSFDFRNYPICVVTCITYNSPDRSSYTRVWCSKTVTDICEPIVFSHLLQFGCDIDSMPVRVLKENNDLLAVYIPSPSLDILWFVTRIGCPIDVLDVRISDTNIQDRWSCTELKPCVKTLERDVANELRLCSYDNGFNDAFLLLGDTLLINIYYENK